MKVGDIMFSILILRIIFFSISAIAFPLLVVIISLLIANKENKKLSGDLLYNRILEEVKK